MTVRTGKSALRDAIKSRLAMVSPEQQAGGAAQIAQHLLADPACAAARTVLAYAALPTEISLDPFITAALAAGKRVAIPRIDWDARSMCGVRISNVDTDLETGRYGVRNPVSGRPRIKSSEIDLILVPGLAFDRLGNRLGRGAGFYDRLIDGLRSSGPAATPAPRIVGVCYELQIVDLVPTEPHDHAMDRVISQQGQAFP